MGSQDAYVPVGPTHLPPLKQTTRHFGGGCLRRLSARLQLRFPRSGVGLTHGPLNLRTSLPNAQSFCGPQVPRP